jgi:hypothetical protein
MKKSFLFVWIGFLGFMIIMVAGDMKLKAEYENRHMKDYLTYTSLPAFHYVKDNFIGKQSWEWYVCNIVSGNKYGVGSGFDISKRILTYVKNDTLFIEKPSDVALNDIAFGVPITVFCGPLKGISALVCKMNITGKMADSLAVSAASKSEMQFLHLSTQYLTITGTDKASITISASDKIPELVLRLKSTSRFTADNVLIENKKLELSDSASLQLTGRSLADFGIKKN